VPFEVVHILADCVRRALIPVAARIGLFGGENVHKAASERVEFVRLLNVLVERGRIELR